MIRAAEKKYIKYVVLCGLITGYYLGVLIIFTYINMPLLYKALIIVANTILVSLLIQMICTKMVLLNSIEEQVDTDL